MTNYKADRRLPGLRLGLALLLASLLNLMPATAGAQSGGTIDAGTTIAVRTNEEIKVTKSDGRVFSGAIDQDVRDTRGQVALPRGTYVELLVKEVGDNEYALDLDSVSVEGRRLGVEAESGGVTAERKEGVGANSRTGKYVGGGAVIGAIVGAIAGGGKGAAIGAGVGAAGGAGTQVLTRGKSVSVPSESLVTFRLEQPLRTGVADRGFSRNGWHYHEGYGTTAGNSAPYDAGLQAGREDRARNRAFNARSTRWTGADLRDYQDGYERGFDESPGGTPGGAPQGDASIRIGADRYITWRGPEGAKVYVQVDNNPRQLFGAEASGHYPAPWIEYGHRYVFTVTDRNGREVARDVNDLRQRRNR
jgi:hypothetical protein